MSHCWTVYDDLACSSSSLKLYNYTECKFNSSMYCKYPGCFVFMHHYSRFPKIHPNTFGIFRNFLDRHRGMYNVKVVCVWTQHVLVVTAAPVHQMTCFNSSPLAVGPSPSSLSPPPSPLCLSFSPVFWQQCSPALQSPKLSACPIVLRTSQVMINTNTQQWEASAPNQRGSRSPSGRDKQTLASLTKTPKLCEFNFIVKVKNRKKNLHQIAETLLGGTGLFSWYFMENRTMWFISGSPPPRLFQPFLGLLHLLFLLYET